MSSASSSSSSTLRRVALRCSSLLVNQAKLCRLNWEHTYLLSGLFRFLQVCPVYCWLYGGNRAHKYRKGPMVCRPWRARSECCVTLSHTCGAIHVIEASSDSLFRILSSNCHYIYGSQWSLGLEIWKLDYWLFLYLIPRWHSAMIQSRVCLNRTDLFQMNHVLSSPAYCPWVPSHANESIKPRTDSKMLTWRCITQNGQIHPPSKTASLKSDWNPAPRGYNFEVRIQTQSQVKHPKPTSRHLWTHNYLLNTLASRLWFRGLTISISAPASISRISVLESRWR